MNRSATTTLKGAAFLVRLLACAFAAIIASTLLATVHPTEALAVDATAYAYLDPDDNGEYTVLVLAKDERPEGQSGYQYLGPIRFSTYNMTATPWDSVKSEITAFRTEGTLQPVNLSELFKGCTALQSVDLSGFDTTATRDMSSLFEDCSSLKSLDLSTFNTSNATDMNSMFQGCSSLESLDLSGFDTANATNMASMFWGCSKLESLDLSRFDTSKATMLNFMFEDCSSLVTVDISSFDTSQASITGMFDGCSSLESLDLSNFDTTATTSMLDLFDGCSSLKSLDLSTFNTANVTSMGGMFSGCSSLESLDLSNFDTSKVTGMYGMFSGCSSLQHLDISGFVVSEEAISYTVFISCDPETLVIGPSFGCSGDATGLAGPWVASDNAESQTPLSGLGELVAYAHAAGRPISFAKYHEPASGTCGTCAWTVDAAGNLTVRPQNGSSTGVLTAYSNYAPWYECSSWIKSARFEGTIKADETGCSRLFQYCSQLRSVDLSGLDTSSATDMSSMFCDCSSLVSLDLSDLDTSNVADMSLMFCRCYSLKSLDLSSFNTAHAINMRLMFDGCSSLSSLDLSGLDTSQATNMESLFCGCQKLKSLNLAGRFDTSSVTNMNSMFRGCSSLESLDLSGFSTSQATDMGSLFCDCRSLTSLDLSDFSTTQVSNMESMFYGCFSLASLDISSLDTSSTTDMRDMFYMCEALESLDFPACFDTSHITTMETMFFDCASLESLDLSMLDTSQVANMNQMLRSCRKLKSVDLSGRFDTSQVTDMYGMFSNCPSLESLDLSGFDTAQVTNMDILLQDCISLKQLAIGQNCTVLSIQGCNEGLWRSSVDGQLYRIADLPSGVDATYTRLTQFEDFVTTAVLDSDGHMTIASKYEIPEAEEGQVVFIIPNSGFPGSVYSNPEDVPWHAYRDKIISVDCSVGSSNAIHSLSIASTAFWFCDCPNLKNAFVSFGYTGKNSISNLDSMFRDCPALETLSIGGSTRNVTSMRHMMHGCRALQSISIGGDFTFRGASDHRLEGSEFPDGVWHPRYRPGITRDDWETAHGTGNYSNIYEDEALAYASNSIPSFSNNTYERVPDSELAGKTVISLYGEGTDKEYTEETVLTAEGDVEVTYDLTNYEGGVFAIEELPSASSAIEKNNATIKPTTLAKIKGTNVTRLIVGTKVGKIKANALAGTNVTHLDVESMKLTGSRVKNSLVGSKVRTITIYWTAKGSQATKLKKAKKVRTAFHDTAGNSIWASWGATASASRNDVVKP